MKTFLEFVEHTNLTKSAIEICELVVEQGVEDMDAFFSEYAYKTYGEELAEAIGPYNPRRKPFAGKKGFWGNLLSGLGGGLKSLFGVPMAGVGGLGGATLGGGVGAAKGAFGKSGDPDSDWTVQGGARAGSEIGRDWMKGGIQGIKDAWGNRKDAKLISRYQDATKALEKLVSAVFNDPRFDDLKDEFDILLKALVIRGEMLERQMKSGSDASPMWRARPAA